jgi:antitoxin (DNA-binding transcriptional repressor) of toxin-antitoxin stability system
MRTIDLSEVAALVPLLQSENQEPLVVTKNGQTVAAIVPTNEDDVESLLLSINPMFQAILDRSQRRLESDGAISSADVRKRLGIEPDAAKEN